MNLNELRRETDTNGIKDDTWGFKTSIWQYFRLVQGQGEKLTNIVGAQQTDPTYLAPKRHLIANEFPSILSFQKCWILQKAGLFSAKTHIVTTPDTFWDYLLVDSILLTINDNKT